MTMKEKYNEIFDTLRELCAIPAPSHMEYKRAEYCKNWLEKAGAKGVYIDDAINVIFPLNCEESNEITVFAAHTDTVFPDTESMPYIDDGEKIHCPGVGDDTASVVVLMMLAKYFIENKIVPPKGIIFVCNSCEEGLGNLKGTRQIFKDFDGRIKQFVSFDCAYNKISDRCVGSHRYEVEVLTEGGHSFQKFGNANAIHVLSEIISEIYKVQIPQKAGSITTYNVGSIIGGTSINTIAQSAKMLCEYRSTDKECLEMMCQKFEEIFENARSEKVQVLIEKIGDRPCSNIDDKELDRLKNICKPIIEQIIHEPVAFESASTDCNIPLSLGIPAICIGVYQGDGEHTREEWIEKASLALGLEIAIKIARLLGEVEDEK